jgi:hypothetical protein
MNHEQFREHLARRPFCPFRVLVKDGRSFTIHHPNLAMAAEAILQIGIPAPDDPNPIDGERKEWVRWADVDVIEPLSRSPSPTA